MYFTHPLHSATNTGVFILSNNLNAQHVLEYIREILYFESRRPTLPNIDEFGNVEDHSFAHTTQILDGYGVLKYTKDTPTWFIAERFKGDLLCQQAQKKTRVLDKANKTLQSTTVMVE